MKKAKYPVERIIQMISEAELPGSSIAEVCRKYSVSRSAFDRWKQKYKGMSSNEAKRLKVIEDENMRLKRILAEKELELQVLRDIVKKTSDHPRKESDCSSNDSAWHYSKKNRRASRMSGQHTVLPIRQG
jgi:putative transposase